MTASDTVLQTSIFQGSGSQTITSRCIQFSNATSLSYGPWRYPISPIFVTHVNFFWSQPLELMVSWIPINAIYCIHFIHSGCPFTCRLIVFSSFWCIQYSATYEHYIGWLHVISFHYHIALITSTLEFFFLRNLRYTSVSPPTAAYNRWLQYMHAISNK